MSALQVGVFTHIHRRDYATAKAVLAELVSLADEKGAAWYKATGALFRTFVSAETKEGADHVHAIASAWGRVPGDRSDRVDADATRVSGDSVCGQRPIR